MKVENKKASIDYWNRNAVKWKDIAYDKGLNYVNFPTSEQRGKIVINEIIRLSDGKDDSILDIGCADGDLLISLISNGFYNVKGIDNSQGMVNEARKRLKDIATNLNEDEIFILGDADQLELSDKYDFISAMGLIEYLINVNSFFSHICDCLDDDGVAFIESRNKLFNLFSANQYTAESNISQLLDELEKSRSYSPITDDADIEGLIVEVYNHVCVESDFNSSQPDSFKEKYPFELPQYSPYEFNCILANHGLKIRHIVYYHAHPFPPVFQKVAKTVFNKLALAMQPLGYTPIGATMFSSFVAIVEKG